MTIMLRQHLNYKMNKQKDQSQEITAFLSRYTLTQLDPATTLIQSPTALYISKCIQLRREQADIDEVMQSLEQHQTLNPNYLLTLINYQIVKSQQSSITVRTLYQYARLTLQQEIAQRRQNNNQRFSEQEIWAIVYSLTKSLQYLEKLGIAYGVLSTDNIFIDKKIKLLDPSAVGSDPFTILPQGLYSPELLNQDFTSDILRSDVFILGLCILQAALLIPQQTLAVNEYDEEKVSLYIKQLQADYPLQLASLVEQMLQFSPENRPTFSQIREYLQNNLEMIEYSEGDFNPSPQDAEDIPNQVQLSELTHQMQLVDSEQQEESCCLAASLNQFQKARIRFLNAEEPLLLNQMSRIEQNSGFSSSFKLENSQVKGDRLSLLSKRGRRSHERRQTSKSIKEKVIKDMSCLQLEITELKDYKKSTQSSLVNQNRYNQIFTSPKLMQQIQRSLQDIARNRGKLKQNVFSGNF